ncbi:ABC transporter transmembrane domain-containing protein [Salisediminibacterium halotolerans]|uniref:ABC transporter transmembrane domain-containing protein n=1 Tax=Salisediminibacterium halotolerans TaxID=517425 RepID=UPI000EADC709|nr:ABC transporter transmembrane domain-containing protein [Salisediminibacterium halotolerans]RLJ74131.1 ATP-binding cassette subfamily B protein [Actinophytocola xinjiangensis]RPE87776.1 ATP-binding cassette subfamily B protein [Salisediminibacterium halotolerans]TWG34968.1 ATP-binding cassette subfamily B protein [Salisediminibacterium halotolerans]GEL07697.1 ABC transporter ATP-binding protein [Salisediminibacterium halotolerans]
MRVFLELKWYFIQERRRYSLGILILASVSLLSLLPPYVVGMIVDHIDQNTLTPQILFNWMTALFGLAVTVYILRYIWRIMIFGSSIRLARQLRNDLYEHFTKQSARFFQTKRTGDLMAHSTNDIRAVEQTAGAGVLTLVDSLTLGGFVIITMAVSISWELTIIALLPMPLMALAVSKYGFMLHKRFSGAQAAFSRLNDKVQESMSGIRVTKTFGNEKDDVAAFRDESANVVKKNIDVAKVDALFDPTIMLIVGSSYFLSISAGGYLVVNETLTIGQLTSFNVYLGMLIWPMLAFGWLFNIVEKGRASYGRIRTILQEEPDIEDRRNAVNTPPRGDIFFDIKRFYFFEDQKPALENISIELPRGQTLGIAGKTGSGKSTLVRTLIRDAEIQDGTIYFAGLPIAEYTLDALRSSVGYVPQDHFLFSATIADNIAFARPDASYTEIINAASYAAVHDDITAFKDGYETVVGERGVTLSGGQKQRISIARALLADPEVLILDDSLSAVDANTEEMILTNLRTLRNDKTTIITAHRLSAIQHARQIVVLENGRIAEQGTHSQLMQKPSWYRRMYERQQLESLIEKGGDDL